MTRRNITKETQKAIDEAITDLLAGRYEGAKETFKNVIDDLRDLVGKGRCYDRFKPYYWTASFGQGLAEEIIEKGEPEAIRDISDVAKEAKSFYNSYISITEYANQHETYKSLGKSYVSLGLKQEGIGVLEQLKRPRMLDFVELAVKARRLLDG